MKMTSYELVNTRDWPKTVAELGSLGTYDIETLDSTWYPVLRDHLQGHQGNGLYGGSADTIDGGSHFVRSSGLQLHSQLSDHIDGRGKFDARELELELKSMPRRDLVKFSILNCLGFRSEMCLNKSVNSRIS